MNISAYVELIQAMPLEVVQRARLKGAKLNQPFPPSAGEFHAICLGFMPSQRPAGAMYQPVPPEPEVERDPTIGIRLRALFSELGRTHSDPEIRRRAMTAADKESERRAAESRLAALKTMPAPKLSPELAKLMGVGHVEENVD